ncbi:somatostatin receptor type 5-like [Lineus longissimus]|uniref:somatostatin receptor type 5-like n=1 Tax=Lineus longissimus TaxID=88925 RepID=UPI00315D7E32
MSGTISTHRDGGISPEEERIFSGLLLTINKILTPAVIVLGLFGNILSIIILGQPRHAKLTTCFYMRVLSAFDSTILLTQVLVRCVVNYHPNLVIEYGIFFCPMMLFTGGTFGLSNLTIAAMTLDRFLAVRFPLKVASWCTKKRCKITSGVIILFCLGLTIPLSMRTFNPRPGAVLKDICGFDPELFPEWYPQTIEVIHSTCMLTAPFFLILIFNVAIILTLVKQRVCSAESQLHFQGTKKKDGHVTVLLFAVTITFFITNIPWTVDQWVWEILVIDMSPRLQMIKKIVYEIEIFLLYLNPSVNFYVYCMACQKFREDVRALFCQLIGTKNDD